MQKLYNQSGYSGVDNSSNPTKYISRLDKVGESALWQGIKAEMLSLLKVEPGNSIIDVGCGTGDDVRAIAKVMEFKGRFVGVDKSSTMIEEAKQRSAGSKLPAEFYICDAENLEFPDNSFDCCRVERVLQHLDNPQKALAEILRITKPGGRIVVVEPDYGSVKIQGSSQQVTCKLLERRCNHFRNGRIGMHLMLLYKRLGLVKIAMRVIQVTNTNIDAQHENFLVRKYIEPAVEMGVISAQEGHRWLEDLKKAEERGDYQHSISLFLIGGCKLQN
ncbi:MAG: methyltransferase domain-containing protein [Scytonematopsis contorta HA4267-MV1]|jgi:ubiquinone/menaquinone biosynthesis C-methylase UbiE|nr:methyltransferase domain-containing protein [Scytonematopsis contorta HA4267-MV1]